MKHIFVFLFSFSFLVSAHADVDKTNPYEMIQVVADQTFERFEQEYDAIIENPELLKVIVREELLPYIDYKYAAYKVIGSHLKKTTKQQRDEFVPIFRDYLVTSYAQVFTLYDGQKITFSPGKSYAGKKIVTVNTVVIEEGGRPPIKIDFKVRLNKKTKEWKAFDMVAEGVSLLDSKQAELSSIIRQKGIEEVANMLKTKSEYKIKFPENNDQESQG